MSTNGRGRQGFRRFVKQLILVVPPGLIAPRVIDQVTMCCGVDPCPQDSLEGRFAANRLALKLGRPGLFGQVKRLRNAD